MLDDGRLSSRRPVVVVVPSSSRRRVRVASLSLSGALVVRTADSDAVYLNGADRNAQSATRTTDVTDIVVFHMHLLLQNVKH